MWRAGLQMKFDGNITTVSDRFPKTGTKTLKNYRMSGVPRRNLHATLSTDVCEI